MSELTDKLTKIASTIDSLLAKITSEETTDKVANEKQSYTNSDFGSLSTDKTYKQDPLLDFILS